MRIPILLLAGCTAPDSALRETGAFGESGAGLLRLGPPAAGVGLGDLAVHAASGRAFVASNNTPFVVVADAGTGRWEGALDLRSFGETKTTERALLLQGDALLVATEARNAFLRWDAATLAAQEPLDLGVPMNSAVTRGDELWVSVPNEVRLYEHLAQTRSFPAARLASAMAVDGEHVALISEVESAVRLYSRMGELAWETSLDLMTLSDVALSGGRVLVSDRLSGTVSAIEDGTLLGSVEIGADVTALRAASDRLLAIARLGAELPDSRADEGQPSLLVALDRDLGIAWQMPLARSCRNLAADGAQVWTSSEGADRLLALDSSAQRVELFGPPLGLAVESVERLGSRVFLASPQAGELWWVDTADGSSGALQTCGWPSLVRLHGRDLWLFCQDEGVVWRVDPWTLEVLETFRGDGTFQAVCEDTTCPSPHVGQDATDDMGVLAYTDPNLPGVRWLDGRRPVALPIDGRGAQLPQHMALRRIGDGLLLHEPWFRRSWLVRDGAALLTPNFDPSEQPFPLVGGGSALWFGGIRLDASLVPEVDLGSGTDVAALGGDWIVALHGWDLEVYAREDLERVASLPLMDLRAPPFVSSRWGAPSPLLLLVAPPDRLAVVNAYRATVEIRHLPDLAPLGEDEPLPLGAWADLPGLY